MDVVVVTLLRDSLRSTLKSVYETIPNPNIILVTEKGVIGELRNKGLMKASSEYVCFVDDDIILNRDWYVKCMKRLEEDDSLTCVAGRTPEMATCGCMICKTKEFKSEGGFPRLDSYLGKKYGRRIVVQKDAICDHVGQGFSMILHQFHWLTHAFQTESKVGINVSPKESFRLIVHFLKLKHPDLAFVQFFWIVKAPFTLPFIFKLHKNRQKP